MLTHLVQGKSILSPFIIKIITLALITQLPNSFAQPNEDQPQEDIVLVYRQLLLAAAAEPTPEKDSLFYAKQVLTPTDIEVATEEFHNLVASQRFPKALEKIRLLKKIEEGEPFDVNEGRLLKIELNSIQSSVQFQLGQLENKESNSYLQRNLLFSTLFVAGSTIVSTVSPLAFTTDAQINREIGWGFYALSGLSSLWLAATMVRSQTWHPEHYRRPHSWLAQLRDWGEQIDAETQILFNTNWERDSGIFPPIPFYSILLNRASSHLDYSRDLAIPSPRSGPSPGNPEHVTLHVQPTGELGDADLNRLNADTFIEEVKKICDSSREHPYALRSQIALRRVLFLSLQRKDTRALYFILNTTLKGLLPKLDAPLGGTLQRTFLLAVQQGDVDLARTFIGGDPAESPPAVFLRPPFTLLERAQELAARHNHTEMIQLLSDFTEGTPATRPHHRIRQTASHDLDTENTLLGALNRLKKRYRRQSYETFARNQNREAELPSWVEAKINHLASNNKLSPLQASAAIALLRRIKEPFDPNAPDYDPDHLFLWNTTKKKQKTLKLLKIAFLALEDPTAFEENTGRKMTTQDQDDNWGSLDPQRSLRWRSGLQH